MREALIGPLSVAMAIVPALYSRNKLFALFSDPAVRRARSRARLVRSVFRQLAGGGASGFVVQPGALAVVVYQVPRVRLTRRVELSQLELSCLAFLCGRAKIDLLAPTAEDRARIDAALLLLPNAPLVAAEIG
jgi:hypothetical protein